MGNGRCVYIIVGFVNPTYKLLPETDLKQAIYVEPGKTTRVEFPLKSTVGNISGKLLIEDDFERKMPVNDFIVSLFEFAEFQNLNLIYKSY